MNDFTILNSEEHKDLKIPDNLSYDYLKNIGNCQIIADEIFMASSCFPIFFIKDEEKGRFLLSVIFTFQNDENLFAGQEGWKAPYLPLNIKRLPLAIDQAAADETSHAHDIYIDLGSKLVSTVSGSGLFHEDGSETDILKARKRILGGIVQGEDKTKSLIESILKYDLMTPLSITLSTTEGDKFVKGIYGIDHVKMKYMDPKSYQGLSEEGALEFIFMMKTSYAQIGRLVWMENKKTSNKIINYSISSDRN